MTNLSFLYDIMMIPCFVHKINIFMKIFHIFIMKFHEFAFIAETVTQNCWLWYNSVGNTAGMRCWT